jgi:hypothetical protein
MDMALLKCKLTEELSATTLLSTLTRWPRISTVRKISDLFHLEQARRLSIK